jgi:hypothetical protein
VTYQLSPCSTFSKTFILGYVIDVSNSYEVSLLQSINSQSVTFASYGLRRVDVLKKSSR